MRRIEFETTVKNGIIKIPTKFKNIWDSKIKVIIMKEERLKKTKREKLLKLLQEAADKEIFSEIKDAVKWQRKQRDEWEKSIIR
jgi:hypothetical protein